MQSNDHVLRAYAELSHLIEVKDWSAAADVARTLPDLSAEDLNTHPYHDLWWHCVEDLADRLRLEDASLARRLFDLVEVSLVKEASMASGAGEAYAVRPHLERVRSKLHSLPGDRSHEPRG